MNVFYLIFLNRIFRHIDMIFSDNGGKIAFKHIDCRVAAGIGNPGNIREVFQSGENKISIFFKKSYGKHKNSCF